ncbi:Cytokine IL1/FGF,Fibroblast growth factor family [Cinara cedri]|uniref:Fibroblast growth factor n=1 Tax=Cinara cedri TaxID=506608 RepID=A0A5E4NPK2_9HEMI|nr:Cytokine IL1/FGF,Fibroblast growth factor family [Cinara cedri]
MEQYETLQTPIGAQPLSVALEEVESQLLTNAKVSMSNVNYCQKNQKLNVTSGTMKHGRRMKLNCRHGYNILIFSNGTVSTSDDDIDNHCILEITSISPGLVRIKGVEADLFLAMDNKGLLYGEPDPTNMSTIFIEQPEGPYSAYLSLKYRRKKWYIAIKKNGIIKRGPETKRRQHATHFLSIFV